VGVSNGSRIKYRGESLKVKFLTRLGGAAYQIDGNIPGGAKRGLNVTIEPSRRGTVRQVTERKETLLISNSKVQRYLKDTKVRHRVDI